MSLKHHRKTKLLTKLYKKCQQKQFRPISHYFLANIPEAPFKSLKYILCDYLIIMFKVYDNFVNFREIIRYLPSPFDASCAFQCRETLLTP